MSSIKHRSSQSVRTKKCAIYIWNTFRWTNLTINDSISEKRYKAWFSSHRNWNISTHKSKTFYRKILTSRSISGVVAQIKNDRDDFRHVARAVIKWAKSCLLICDRRIPIFPQKRDWQRLTKRYLADFAHNSIWKEVRRKLACFINVIWKINLESTNLCVRKRFRFLRQVDVETFSRFRIKNHRCNWLIVNNRWLKIIEYWSVSSFEIYFAKWIGLTEQRFRAKYSIIYSWDPESKCQDLVLSKLRVRHSH